MKKVKKGDGIIPQIQSANTDPKAYTSEGIISMDDFKNFMDTLYKKTDEKLQQTNVVVETPNDGIKLKIKEGWLYQIGSPDSIVAYTDFDGAVNYIDVMRANGISDHQIGEEIYIANDTSSPLYKLNDITWRH